MATSDTQYPPRSQLHTPSSFQGGPGGAKVGAAVEASEGPLSGKDVILSSTRHQNQQQTRLTHVLPSRSDVMDIVPPSKATSPRSRVRLSFSRDSFSSSSHRENLHPPPPPSHHHHQHHHHGYNTGHREAHLPAHSVGTPHGDHLRFSRVAAYQSMSGVVGGEGDSPCSIISSERSYNRSLLHELEDLKKELIETRQRQCEVSFSLCRHFPSRCHIPYFFSVSVHIYCRLLLLLLNLLSLFLCPPFPLLQTQVYITDLERRLEEEAQNTENIVTESHRLREDRDEWRGRFERLEMKGKAMGEKLRRTEKELYRMHQKKYDIQRDARREARRELLQEEERKKKKKKEELEAAKRASEEEERGTGKDSNDAIKLTAENREKASSGINIEENNYQTRTPKRCNATREDNAGEGDGRRHRSPSSPPLYNPSTSPYHGKRLLNDTPCLAHRRRGCPCTYLAREARRHQVISELSSFLGFSIGQGNRSKGWGRSCAGQQGRWWRNRGGGGGTSGARSSVDIVLGSRRGWEGRGFRGLGEEGGNHRRRSNLLVGSKDEDRLPVHIHTPPGKIKINFH